MVKKRYMDIDVGCQSKPYRLIFMDYSMPILDGIQTTRLIQQLMVDRGLDPNNINECPYICCLSAYVEDSYVENALSAGMHNFMTKPASPFNVKILLSSLNILK